MNPVIQGIGALASVLGIGSSLFNQGLIAHRQLHPPQQQAQMQQQQCPWPGQLEVVTNQFGQRQLVCMQEGTR